MPNARPIDLAALRALRQSTKPWQMALRPAPRNADPAGLFELLVVVSPGANAIRFMAPMRGPVGADELLAALEEAMLQTGGTSGPGRLPPARPPAIHLDDPALAEQIALPMEGCGVRVTVQRELPAIDPVLRALGERTNLFSVAGQAPPEPKADRPFLLESEHTIAVEPCRGRPTLVIRATEPEAVEEVFAALDGIALARRRADGREVEVLVALQNGETAVLSVVGVSDDLPSLGEELGEGDELPVAIVSAQEDPSSAQIILLPRRDL